ncbi:hypothetical protein [Bradyrhizobium retamae]|uniref:Uncharacterized protein n=1 Tax=Bradyrhizobium retamae TaxID=1300035 RepID=A0A0R3MLS0_9BRAD|nr:hypothetical protein CQ13_35805 [Bradyrhizobium retamae]
MYSVFLTRVAVLALSRRADQCYCRQEGGATVMAEATGKLTGRLAARDVLEREAFHEIAFERARHTIRSRSLY